MGTVVFGNGLSIVVVNDTVSPSVTGLGAHLTAYQFHVYLIITIPLPPCPPAPPPPPVFAIPLLSVFAGTL